MKHYQTRQRFFYAVPSLFPNWPYPSRLAVGIKLSDACYRMAPVFKFKIKDTYYTIKRELAIEMGNKFMLVGGKLPNLIPKEALHVVESKKKKEVETGPKPVYTYDYKKGICYISIPKETPDVKVQMQLI